MICGTSYAWDRDGLDGPHNHGPFNLCDNGVKVRNYKQKEYRMYETPTRLLKVGTTVFNGHGERGLPIGRAMIGEISDLERVMRDVEPECKAYVTRSIPVTPGKALPSGPGGLP